MRSWWPWLWGVLGVALIVRAAGRSRGVITDHLEFGRRLFCGEELYLPFLEAPKPLHPPYPPSFGLLTGPFSLGHHWFGEMFARTAWVTVQVAALFWIGLFLRNVQRRLAPELQEKLNLALFVTALVSLRYILRDTHGGGGNLINLALLLVAVHLAGQGPKSELWGGLVLGFSIATKPTGILVVPLLWVFGRRRAATVSVLAAAGFLAIALAINRHGMDPFIRWFDGSLSYAAMTNLFVEPEYGFPRFTWMNQCLRCAVARYCSEVPAEWSDMVPGFFQGLGLSYVATAWVSRLSALALLGISALAIWRSRGRSANHPYHLAAILCLSLLLSPISWKAHHVALIPAIFLIVLIGLRGSRWAWVFLAAYVLVCGLGAELVGRGFKEVQQSLYLQTAGTLAILGIMLYRSRQPVDSSLEAGT